MNYRDWNEKEANPYGWDESEIKACYGNKWNGGYLNGYSTDVYYTSLKVNHVWKTTAAIAFWLYIYQNYAYVI